MRLMTKLRHRLRLIFDPQYRVVCTADELERRISARVAKTLRGDLDA